MAYQINTTKIPLLLKALTKWLPACLPVYQMIKRYNNNVNTWPGVTIYNDSDDMEKITTVLCFAGDYENKLTGKTYYFYSVDDNRLKFLINDVVDWTNDLIQFKMTNVSQMEVVQQVGENHKRYLHGPKSLGCCIYTGYDQQRLLQFVSKPLPDGFQLRPLQEEHASLVQSIWSYTDPMPSIKHFINLTQHLPNLAIYHGTQVVSWAVVKASGDIGHTFTLPEYRGRGFSSIITANLAMKLLEAGNTPYVAVETTNTESAHMHEKLGFVRQDCPEIYYYFFSPDTPE
ncbi:glycine N-acyltransferase-like [Glandiceps talaboti]